MNIKKIAAAICVGLCLTLGFASNASADSNAKRLQGSNRYGTNTAVANSGWQSSCDFAVITTGENYPDALSAAPLAKRYNAPVFLTSKDNLDNQANESEKKVSDELKRLNVKKVFIVGGTGVVSQAVEDAVKGMGIQTQRVYGMDRYLTSLEVAKQVGASKGVMVTISEKYEDALSAAPIAAAKGMPLILVEKNYVPDEVIQYLKAQNTPKVYLIGGNDVISDEVSKKFEEIATVERITGKDASERNINLLYKFQDSINFSKAYFTSVSGYADGISGSALAALTSSPVILVDENNPEAIKNIEANAAIISEVNILGGEGVLKPALSDKLLSNTIYKNELVKASLNGMNIKSMEGLGSVKIDVSAKGLPEEIQPQIDKLLLFVNGATIDAGIKMNSNEDKTASRVVLNLDVNKGMLTLPVWVDSDISGAQPKIKEVVGIPPILALAAPELAGKKYFVMDPMEILSAMPEDAKSQMPVMDYKKLAEFSNELQGKITKFAEKYAEQWNPDVTLITYKGMEQIKTPEGVKNAKVYKIKIDDATLKYLIAYTVENFISNKEALSFTKDLITSYLDVLGVSDEATRKEIELAFINLNANSKDITNQFKEFMLKINDLKLLGDKGIEETYYLVDNYIIGVKGMADLQLDLGKLGEIVKRFNPEDKSFEGVTGIVSLCLTYETYTYNINGDVKIDMPETNSQNSINFMDLMNGMGQPNAVPPVQPQAAAIN